MNIPSLLQSANTQFDAKTPRERLLMVAAIAALLYFIVDASVMTKQRR